MKKLSVICMTVLAVAFLASCRGPMGPQGPAGQDGNANVVSAKLTIKSSDWYWIYYYTDVEGYERGQYAVTIDFPQYPVVNDNVFNHGAVLVYMKVDGAWSQVPLTYYYHIKDNGEDFLYETSIEVATLSDGGVRLFCTESDMWKVDPPAEAEFKIVAIQASAYSHRSDVDYSNYEAVKTAFQLAD